MDAPGWFRTPLQVVGAGGDVAALRTDPLWSRLDSFAGAHGFSHWLYSAIPIGHREGPCAVTVTTYPEAHTRAYFARRLDRTNPGRAYARTHDRPTTYAMVRKGAMPASPALTAQLALNRLHDVSRGVLIPLHGSLGIEASLGLAYEGSERDLDMAYPQLIHALSDFATDLHREIQSIHADRFAWNRLPHLTRRQREVLRQFADGRSHAEIADRLGLSIHTIDKHVAHIKTRLGARSLAQAIALSIRWRQID